jgi:hypothetical protein
VKIDRLTIDHPDDVDRLFWATKPNNDLVARLEYSTRVVNPAEPIINDDGEEENPPEEDETGTVRAFSLSQWYQTMRGGHHPLVIDWNLVSTGGARVTSSVLAKAELMR